MALGSVGAAIPLSIFSRWVYLHDTADRVDERPRRRRPSHDAGLVARGLFHRDIVMNYQHLFHSRQMQIITCSGTAPTLASR
jgi:hypothetical protein